MGKAEEWRPFPNHPMYEVSSIGRVRRTDTGRIRTPVKIKNGYMTVMLTDLGFSKLEYIHRAVAMAFIPNRNNLPQVNHLDHDRGNNRVENLEWCTALHNVQHGVGKQISQYTKEGGLVRSFPGVREAERQLGLCRGSIDRAARGGYKTSYGFIWRYE